MTESSSQTELPSLPLTPGSSQQDQNHTQKLKGFIVRQWELTRQDLKSIGWVGALKWLPFALLLAGLLLLTPFLTGPFFFNGYISGYSACDQAGDFTGDQPQENYWAMSNFFKVNVAFGQLSFVQAKIIDVVWDVVVGRGGQFVMAMVSWNVFADYVTTSMEMTRVTYRIFWVIFIANEPTVTSIYQLARDFTSRCHLVSRRAMVFMLFSMSFIVAFPTLQSAMTAYDFNFEAYIKDLDGNNISPSEFRFVLYIIHDGKRAGLGKDDYPVTLPKLDAVNRDRIGQIFYYDCARYADFLNRYNPSDWGIVPENCYTISNTTEHVQRFGYFGTAMIPENTTFLGSKIEGNRSLRISGYQSLLISGEKSTAKFEPPRNQTIDENLYLYSGRTYKNSQVMQNGVCQVQNTYRWGFSFLQLFIMTLLLWVWSTGTYFMWLKAHKLKALRGRTDVSRGYKSALELAATIRNDFEERHEDPSQLTTTELEDKIKRNLKGGKIGYTSPDADEKCSLLKSLWNPKSNLIWSLAILIACFFTITGFHYWFKPVFPGIIVFFALIYAVLLAPTPRARIFIAIVVVIFLILVVLLPLFYIVL